jgi:hypothetical protein
MNGNKQGMRSFDGIVDTWWVHAQPGHGHDYICNERILLSSDVSSSQHCIHQYNDRSYSTHAYAESVCSDIVVGSMVRVWKSDVNTDICYDAKQMSDNLQFGLICLCVAAGLPVFFLVVVASLFECSPCVAFAVRREELAADDATESEGYSVDDESTFGVVIELPVSEIEPSVLLSCPVGPVPIT